MNNSNVGIDLGTTNIRIYVEDKGIVIDEPSVIAYDEKNKEVVDVGIGAYKMLGKSPDNINVCYPIKDGVISNYNLNTLMIKGFFKKLGDSSIVKPKVVLSIHPLLTDLEKRSVIEASIKAGARKTYLIEQPIAAALGANINISKPNGVMIINIGGGTIDAAIISMNGVVESLSVKYAGNYCNETIKKKILNNHKILIGDQTVEELKQNLATAFNPNPTKEYKVKGKSAVNGLPKTEKIAQEEIFSSIKKELDEIVNLIKRLLEDVSPEIAADVHTNGIILCGGGSKLRGLKEYIKNKTDIDTIVAEHPSYCVALGTNEAFNLMDKLNSGFIDTQQKSKR